MTIRLKASSAAELVDYAARLKARFLSARGAIESMAQEGSVDIPATLNAGGDLVAAALMVRPLVKHPATLTSPIAGDVLASAASIRRRLVRIVSIAPAAVISRRPAELMGEILGLFEAYEHLIVRQLALIHRRLVMDYFGGLDERAPFPSYRCSAANRGAVRRFESEPESHDRVWNTSIGGLIWPTPIVGADGTLYTGHADGEFVALGADGAVKWRISDDRMMYIDSTGALGKDGFLYMASTDSDPRGHQNQGRIWKIAPGSGEVVWTFWGLHYEDPEANPAAHLSSFFEGNVALGFEEGEVFVYAGSDDNFLYKLDSDGNLLWEYDTGSYPSGVIWTKPLLSPDGRTVFAGDLAGQLHAVDTSTGGRRWVSRLGGSVVSSPALGAFGELFIGAFDGKVYALAPEDGSVFWTYQTLGLIYSSPAVAENGDVVICSSDGGIYRLDRFGRRLWTYYADAPVKSSPVIDPDGCIYFGSQGGKLYCLAGDGRRVWSYQTNPGVPENDINCSPALGADGTVYFGTTTGEVFAIPRGYYYANRTDESVELSPRDDGEKPDIPPRGAKLLFMDRRGTPVFEPTRDLAVTENFNMALFAVDANMDIVPAEILPGSVAVEVTPSVSHSSRTESMGRYLYVMPDTFLEQRTEYYVRATGRYLAQGEERPFDSNVLIRTAETPGVMPSYLSPGEEGVAGLALTGFRICQPKEIDALGQAMMDSLKFAIAPVHFDCETGSLLMAASMLVDREGTLEYTAATVNKLLLSGNVKDDAFRLEGSVRLIAQGANIPLDKVVFKGRFTPEPGIEDGTVFIGSSIEGVPDFADIIRVMRLADSEGDVVGFCTYEGIPFESAALLKPDGLSLEIQVESGRLVASFDAPGYLAGNHWLQVLFIDRNTGRLLPGNTLDIKTGARGELEEISISLPGGAEGAAMAVVVLDLFPAARLDI